MAQLAKGIMTLENFLQPSECQAFIDRAEARGFEDATISADGGQTFERDIRNNERLIIDDQDLAFNLWEKLEAFVPKILQGRQARGVNERFRVYRYTPGQQFKWHVDAPFRRENGEVSQLTFMIYLNDGYRGGATRFEEVEVVGKTGMALIFEHSLFHEGAEVLEGVKYVLRSDIMYGPVGKFYG